MARSAHAREKPARKITAAIKNFWFIGNVIWTPPCNRYSSLWQIHGERRFFPQQGVAIPQDPLGNSRRHLFAVIGVGQPNDIFFVGEEPAFHQNRGVTHIRDDVKLLRSCSAIYRLRPRDDRLLDRRSQALALNIRRLRRSPPQEWEPGSDLLGNRA